MCERVVFKEKPEPKLVLHISKHFHSPDSSNDILDISSLFFEIKKLKLCLRI